MARHGGCGMKASQRLILATAASTLLAAVMATGACVWWRPVWAAQLPDKATQSPTPKEWPQGRMFTREETYTFLDAAKRAERIADPLQRCLAYPDPPGSHWNHAAVAAYCQYRYQPIVTPDQVRTLIQQGQAAELDRKLAAALHAQQTQPDARSRLDRIYDVDFNSASPDLRALVDAWQRQSPDSAFAAAASGRVYGQMAFAARGAKRLRNTPRSNLASMDRLALLADADLQRAVQLNPAITPAYESMENIGGYSYLGCGYAFAGATKGLAVDSDNFALYDTLMWLAQPKWCGSEALMQLLQQRAEARATRNPLLYLIKSAGAFNLIDACKCSGQQQLGAYIAVLDHIGGGRELKKAGDAASEVNNLQAMAIYLSEALRFDQSLDDARIRRIDALVDFDEVRWAIDEANALLAKSPDSTGAYKARAWAELQGENDLPAAQRDLLKATELDPHDVWALAHLGGVYMQNGQQWHKAEDVADRLIAINPDNLDGWSLRASVQFALRQPGFEATLNEVSRRFGSDTRIAADVARMRDAWQRQAKRAAPASGSTSPSRN